MSEIKRSLLRHIGFFLVQMGFVVLALAWGTYPKNQLAVIWSSAWAMYFLVRAIETFNAMP